MTMQALRVRDFASDFVAHFVSWRFLFVAAALAVLAFPPAAQAQGVIKGAEQGATDGSRTGNKAAGPVGGAVGGAVGAGVGGVVGGVNGVLGIDNNKRKRKRSNH